MQSVRYSGSEAYRTANGRRAASSYQVECIPKYFRVKVIVIVTDHNDFIIVVIRDNVDLEPILTPTVRLRHNLHLMCIFFKARAKACMHSGVLALTGDSKLSRWPKRFNHAISPVSAEYLARYTSHVSPFATICPEQGDLRCDLRIS